MRSTTEHIPLNSGTGRYIYRVTIDIDSMFDTAYGNFTRKKNIRKNRKKKKESGHQKISSKRQLTGILTELPGNRNFFSVAGINSGQTGMLCKILFVWNLYMLLKSVRVLGPSMRMTWQLTCVCLRPALMVSNFDMTQPLGNVRSESATPWR